MGTYTSFTLTAPPAFMQRWDDTSVEEKVKQHLKALEELGVSVDIVDTDMPQETLPGVVFGKKHNGEKFFEVEDGYRFEENTDGTFHLHARFYDWAAAFTRISAAVPGLFVLEGYGEEAGDHWRMYFKGGKYYGVRPSFPEFDEDNLR